MKGQGLVDYSIILLLVAMAVMMLLSLVDPETAAEFEAYICALTGICP